MLDERKASILRAVVEEYIETAQPVGSAHVAGSRAIKVSSATVRHNMAALEQEGYLHQPHTSAGRVPTEKGYRWFVDQLGGRPHLGEAEVAQVRSFFAQAHRELEQMLADTSHLLSDITHSAALVIGPQSEAAPVRSVQLVGLSPRVVLLVIVLANGTVDKHTLELADDVGEERLAAATAHLSAHLVGSPLGVLDRLDRRGVPSSGDAATDRVVEAAVEAVSTEPDASLDHVYVGGTAHMAAAFDAVETVRKVLSFLEQQYVVVSLLNDVLGRGLHVAIGSETGLKPLEDCALVVAPYTIEGEDAGTIGVLGPTRMNYPQALAAVAVVSRRLGRHLSEG